MVDNNYGENCDQPVSGVRYAQKLVEDFVSLIKSETSLDVGEEIFVCVTLR